MNPVHSPYAPGAGTRPPELVGRDAIIEDVGIALQRIRRGRPAKSVLMVGLRGVGKTVLLRHILSKAQGAGFSTLWIEAPEGRSLPSFLAPMLRQSLLSLSKREKAAELARRGLRALAGFVSALKARYADIEVRVEFEPEAGLADSGDLEQDLIALLHTCGQAAAEADTALVLFVDELQYVPEEQLASLITSLHSAAQHALPIALVGAGLPQLRAHMGRAKSYAERLFTFPVIGELREEDARAAIVRPARAEGVRYEPEAVDAIIGHTRCYPYFLQEWGKHAWDVADASPITAADVASATDLAIAALDESFFRVRFDRATPSERVYLRAMAQLGPGPHRSGDIAELLKRPVTALAPTRANLIKKGSIWSPGHGDTAFTVPLFDQFMRRIMPGDEWREG